jgi:tRNA nucleotidyltransferase (CCA-adding enzyme)
MPHNNTTKKIATALDFLKLSIVESTFKNRVFLAGGIVRDIILKHPPKDIDVVVTGNEFAGIEFTTWLAKKSGNFKDNSNPVIFPTYFTSKLSLRGVVYDGIDLSDVEIEAVAPRKEKYTSGNRNPSVEISTLEEDAFRRDLCLNSLFLNISTGEILDYTGNGIADIKNKILRTPIDPYKTFEDDGLRMLRIVRFYARYGWKIPLSVVRAMKKNAHIIKTISAERIKDELDKIILTDNVKRAFKLMRITTILDNVIPEFVSSYKMTQNHHHDETVFDHILSVVETTPKVLITRYMALFHDIGKTKTKSIDEDGSVHFYAHEMVGEKISEIIMRRLKFSNDAIEPICLGVQNHMRLKSGGDDAIKLSDKALRKFKVALGDQLENLLDVMHADNVAHSEASSMPNQINNIRKRLANLSMPTEKPSLPINGNDLIELGLKPSPDFAKIMSAVTDAWYENPNITREEALVIVRKIANI